MPVNWDELDLDSIIDEAAAATDDKLAARISSLTRMTDEEIKQLFPKKADVKKLAELMSIVKSSENQNNKINNIVGNAEKFGALILTLLDKFI
jgi:hypothetical protein